VRFRTVLLLMMSAVLITVGSASAHPLLEADIGAFPLDRGSVAQFQQDGVPYYVYLPASAPSDSAVEPLIAIHGFGENPVDFVKRMIPEADKHGWLLVAPDLPSGDWKDQKVIKADARQNLPWLHRLVERIQASSPVPVRDHVLVYGFSLGAQTGHRFTMAYPDHVLAAAVMSAGTYTLPSPASVGKSSPAFPMGTADLDSYSGQPFDFDRLKSTHFWVGVGDQDTVAADVPREFDGTEGSSRKERAQNFARVLQSEGIPVKFQSFPGQAHYETPQSLDAAASFLDQVCKLAD
jgi:pimeloyl-ACP methyl ester carboxylesterase